MGYPDSCIRKECLDKALQKTRIDLNKQQILINVFYNYAVNNHFLK